MKILIIGSSGNLAEVKQKFGDVHVYTHVESHSMAKIEKCDVIFDFVIDEHQHLIDLYRERSSAVIFLNTTMTSLKKLTSDNAAIQLVLFGFCGLPTFLNRELLEVSLLQEEHLGLLKKTCEALNTSFQVVADRVGLVTPRVICMIINEAYSTVEDGTATREDIDLAMKLGTNYPYGPFEWCERIGASNVIRVLDAVYHETKEERYRVCDLLKTKTVPFLIKNKRS